jgi:hypothetical protein
MSQRLLSSSYTVSMLLDLVSLDRVITGKRQAAFIGITYLQAYQT